MRKWAALLTITILTLSSLTVESAFAQSISEQSVPELTIRFVGKQYEASIKNILGASYYNFRYKLHYGGAWSYYPSDPDSISGYNLYDSYDILLAASSSSYTVIPLTFMSLFIQGEGQIDVQVQALFGSYRKVPYAHPTPLPAPTYDFYYTGETSNWSETVTFTYDLTPPHISILSPKQQAYFTSDVALTFSANEPLNQTVYSLDGKTNVTILGNITLTDLSKGLHTVTVYAWDTFGNTGAPTSSFVVTMTSTEMVLFVIASSTAIIIAVIGAAAYIRKRNKLKERNTLTPYLRGKNQ